MMTSLSEIFAGAAALVRAGARWLNRLMTLPVYFGRCRSCVPDGSLVVFPLNQTMFGCGIAGIVAFKPSKASPATIALADLNALADRVRGNGLGYGGSRGERSAADYLGGDVCLESLWNQVQSLKREDAFVALFGDDRLQSEIDRLAAALAELGV